MITDEMKDVADRLLGWRGTRMIGADDVVIWMRSATEVGVGFTGPALRMERAVLYGDNPTLENRRFGLDLDLQRALGFSAELRGGYVARQTMDEPDPYIASVLEGVEQLVAEKLEVNDARATLIPDDGAPWSPKNDPTEWYSAKKRRTFLTERPSWITVIETREGEKKLGADVCALMPTVQCADRETVGRLPSGTEFLVTHSVDVTRRHGGDPAAMGAAVRGCGGFIFPSLAVSAIPATNFGPLVFVAPVTLALASMRPYKKRGAWPIVVYSTDSWTVTTKAIVTEGSVELFEELTGNKTFGYSHDHFWSLGAPIERFGGFRPTEARVVDSTTTLGRQIAKRMKHWRRGMTDVELEANREALYEKNEFYPYLEGKVNGVLPVNCFPIAVYPKGDRESVSFLDAVAFAGDRLVLSVPKSLRDAMAEDKASAQWEYGWLVRDALLEVGSALDVEA